MIHCNLNTIIVITNITNLSGFEGYLPGLGLEAWDQWLWLWRWSWPWTNWPRTHRPTSNKPVLRICI